MDQVNAIVAMASPSTEIVRNEILATLPPALFEELRPFLDRVKLRRHAVINEQFKSVDAVHFIESGMVSRVTRTQDDGYVEVAVVGWYGFIGVSVVLGTMTALQRAVVQIPGDALRISANDLTEVMARVPAIRDHLLRYVHTLMNLNSQIALCNAKHSIDKRVARWLLLANERVNDGELPVTHDMLAGMLGVRRPGVTDALTKLEQAQVVTRARGFLKIMDVPALKANACSCYKIINDRFLSQRAVPHFQHFLTY